MNVLKKQINIQKALDYLSKNKKVRAIYHSAFINEFHAPYLPLSFQIKIQVCNIHAEEIAVGNPDQTLALVWTLILNFGV